MRLRRSSRQGTVRADVPTLGRRRAHALLGEGAIPPLQVDEQTLWGVFDQAQAGRLPQPQRTAWPSPHVAQRRYRLGRTGSTIRNDGEHGRRRSDDQGRP